MSKEGFNHMGLLYLLALLHRNLDFGWELMLFQQIMIMVSWDGWG